MTSDLIPFFAMQRSIFGICPCCGELFRLSDCKVFMKVRPVADWMDNLEQGGGKLDRAEERLAAKEHSIRQEAREKGRKRARAIIRKVDPVFTPRRLNPDDAKVIFHPVDYLVFNGMKQGGAIRDLIFLDREAREREHRQLQRSIERAIEKGHYEWQTLRVDQDGSINAV